MSYQRSPYFDTPPRPKKLWKYMHIDKFMSMLSDNALFFPSITSFNDLSEGSLSQKSKEEVFKTNLLEDNTPIKQDNEFFENKKQMETTSHKHKTQMMRVLHSFTRLIKDFSNHFMLCNCWFLSDNESHSMWAEYGDKSPTSIAIQTSVSDLIKSVESNPYHIHIGKVKYKDYEKEHIEGYEEFTTINLKNPDNVLELFYAPIMHKRKVFADEHEVRAVISFETVCNEYIGQVYTSEIPFYSDHLFSIYSILNDSNKTNLMKDVPKGFNLNIDIKTLIQKVVTSPYANMYFEKPLKELLTKHNINPDIVEGSKIKSIY